LEKSCAESETKADANDDGQVGESSDDIQYAEQTFVRTDHGSMESWRTSSKRT